MDYVKLWEEKAKMPITASGSVEELDERKLFDEIKFLSWSSENSKFIKTDDAILDELRVYEEFKSLIISGKYIDIINEAKQKRDQNVKEKIQELSNVVALENNKNRPFIGAQMREQSSGNQRKEEKQQTSNDEGSRNNIHHVHDEPDIVLESITSHETLYEKEDATNSALRNRLEQHQFLAPINVTTTASDKTLSSAFVEEDDGCDTVTGSSLSMNLLTPSTSGAGTPNTSQHVLPGGGSNVQESTDEDNVIQDLLEDIRGSFERQFDDDFNFDQRYANIS